MTHLFAETHKDVINENVEGSYYHVRRSGSAATLLNISYFEPETVHRVFNELFVLLVNPSLDKYFRNPKTVRLKDPFVFIVKIDHQKLRRIRS